MMTDFDKDISVELFQIRVQGALARMFSERQITPTEREWKFIRGEIDLTIRDFGEMAYRTGFDVAILMNFRQNQKEDEE